MRVKTDRNRAADDSKRTRDAGFATCRKILKLYKQNEFSGYLKMFAEGRFHRNFQWVARNIYVFDYQNVVVAAATF